MTFNHIIVYTDKIPESVEFYQKVARMKLIYAMDDYARLYNPKIESSMAIHYRDFGDQRPDNSIVLYFEMDEVEEHCKQLSEEGVEFKQMAQLMPWGWTHSYLYDPAGHEISLYSSHNTRLSDVDKPKFYGEDVE